MTYRRKLAKTYKYFTENLKGIVLNGYNIVGDGTPQALIPIFTGKTELEFNYIIIMMARFTVKAEDKFRGIIVHCIYLFNPIHENLRSFFTTQT
jgi:hypothetical protein